MASTDDKFYRARITHRENFAPDLWKVKIDPGGEFNFVAGQYATLGVESPIKRVERAYSIVSSPYEHELEIFIELVHQGELTPLLHQLPAGAELSLRKIAKGRFTLDLKSGHRNHLLLSTVTGVAPYVSFIRTLHADWKANKFPGEPRLYVIQGASRSWEFGYRDELERIAGEVPWFEVCSDCKSSLRRIRPGAEKPGEWKTSSACTRTNGSSTRPILPDTFAAIRR